MPGSFRSLIAGARQAFLTLVGYLGPQIRPRMVIVAVVLSVLATSLLGITAYRALAIGGGQVFDGTKAPGAHEWWLLNRDNVEAEFCGKCHAKIVAEVAATRATGSHPIATCEGCHGARTAGQGHVAVPRKCSDCHPGQAKDLLADAHSSFIRDIGESADRPSWSCKACHTKVDIDMQVTPIAPIRLILGGVDAPSAAAPTPTPTPGASASVRNGEAVFNGFCNSCHPGGKQGAGPAIIGLSGQQVTTAVRAGKGAMPAFGADKITDRQLDDLVAFVNTLR